MEDSDLTQFFVNTNCPITRRNFLKSSGLVIVCMSIFSCGDQDKPFEKVSWIELKINPKDFALGVVLGNPYLCSGCRRCEIVCSSLRYPNLIRNESSLIKLDPKRFDGLFVKFSSMWAPDTCRQCKVERDAPWCIKACPTGACHIDKKTRTRIINPDACIGCGACVDACPYQMVVLDTFKQTIKAPGGIASKCDLCSGMPACVLECPTGALQFYTPWVKKGALPGTI